MMKIYDQKIFFSLLAFAAIGTLVVFLRGQPADFVSGSATLPSNDAGDYFSNQAATPPPKYPPSLPVGQSQTQFTGCIEQCQYSEPSCGDCYCLRFERGCPQIQSSNGLSRLLGKKVQIDGAEGIFGTAQCAKFLNADTIDVLGDC